MRRVLFEFYGRPVSSYWFFYFLGMFCAACLGLCLAHFRQIKLWKVLVTIIAMVIFAFSFGRIGAFCLRGTFSGIFNMQKGGQVSFGAVVGALLIMIFFANLFRVSMKDAFDISACAIPAAQGIQRIGCFLHGCCFGPVSKSFLAVRFPKYLNEEGQIIGSPCFIHHLRLNLVKPTDLYSMPVFPVQLVAVLGCLVISGICVWMLIRHKFEGSLLWIYFIMYGTFRFIVQWFRPNYDGDDAVSGWNSGHTMSIIMLFTGIIFLLLFQKGLLLYSGKELEGHGKGF